ncbi:MAG: HAMP domain-containing protein, partial [Alphaproteobacteria bacterium]|nr:HAMP domain-containing protein [Alphaproteobacteria bacterium]
MTALAPTSGPLIARVRLWSARAGLGRKLAFCLAAAAVASGVATVAAMTEVWSSGPPDPRTVLIFLSLDVLLLLMLGGVVAWRLAAVWAERRRGLAGSGLHVRLVTLFSLATVTPAILVAVFSGVFLNLGIESWFDQRVRTALDQSQKVASAYLHEHRQSIRADAFAMANDLNRDAPTLMRDARRFSEILSAQAALRSLPEALVVDSGGRVLARSELSLSLEFELAPPEAMELAALGEIVVLTPGQEDRVRAVIRLDRFVDAYLLVGRFVDPRVLNYVESVEMATSQYKRLEKRLKDIQIIFVIIFVLVVLLLLLAAVWVGMAQATQLARPISNLISAAERVRKGDLGVRVEDSTRADELGILSRAFNRMTDRLESQQTGLMEANRQLDERRRFMETVLAGVSAGVIGLDIDGRINLT